MFSPSLFLGATLGGAYGVFASMLFPDLGVSTDAFVVAGMAGMVSGATGAVLTAITMLFEMTRDYNAVLPIVLVVALAYFTRKMISKESIYTLKLTRLGRAIHEGLQAAMSSAQQAHHVMSSNFHIHSLAELKEDPTLLGDDPTVVEENGLIVGVLAGGTRLDEIVKRLDRTFLLIDPNMGIIEALRKMREGTKQIILVSNKADSLEAEAVCGIVTSHEIAYFAGRAAELMF